MVVNRLWKETLVWLKNPFEWPQDPILVPDEQTRAEAKVKVKNEVSAATVIQSDVFDELLNQIPSSEGVENSRLCSTLCFKLQTPTRRESYWSSFHG